MFGIKYSYVYEIVNQDLYQAKEILTGAKSSQNIIRFLNITKVSIDEL